MKVDRFLGPKTSNAVAVQSDDNELTVQLKGSFWSHGPLADEAKWLDALLAKKQAVAIEFKQCQEIGVYTMVWIVKLGRELKKQGLECVLRRPPAKINKFIDMLGFSLEKNGLVRS